MNLTETIAAAGMTPPRRIVPGRWIRFPGLGKGRSNRAGWCRMITETLAIYGDWSSGLKGVWRDDAHRDDEMSARLLREAQDRERRFAAEQRQRQQNAAQLAQQMIDFATQGPHPYLEKKGFGHLLGLVYGDHLLIPVRDVESQRLISVQRITAEGEKKFLHGARARGGVHRIGSRGKTFLCEGYATGLSIYEAAKRLYRHAAVIVCFSAGNLEIVAQRFPEALVCADNDASGTGERIAKRTGLPWIMPPKSGQDFNDLHRECGVYSLIERIRLSHDRSTAVMG